MWRFAFTFVVVASLLLGLQVRMACTHDHAAPDRVAAVAMASMTMPAPGPSHHGTPADFLADLQCKANCSAALFVPVAVPSVSTPVFLSFVYRVAAPALAPGVTPLPDPLPPRALRQI